jgi:hypothetical protein
MSYNPNINDPRTQKRIKKAIAFTNAFLSDTKPRGWSTRYIDKYFGQQQHDLSNWLRTKLLICTNDRYAKDTGICKEYIKNSTGLNDMVSLLETHITYPSVSQVGAKTKQNTSTTISVSQVTKDFIKEEFSKELKSKKFVYEDKSNRLWHDLQRVRKEYKQQIFSESGLKYEYDIECCAPTLIHQYSQTIPEIIHNDKWIQGPMDLYLFALRRYLTDRKTVRNELAIQAEITYEQAKEIISALLMGAQLGHNKDSDIYKLLKGDTARIEFLKQNEYLKQLREDIKTCWDYIKPTLPVTYITDKKNKQRRLPISNKQKAGVYFDLERKVLNTSRDYLDRTNNKYFLEHDGFVCEKEINKEELLNWIKINTGFDIKLDQVCLFEKESNTYPSVSQVQNNKQEVWNMLKYGSVLTPKEQKEEDWVSNILQQELIRYDNR